MAGGRGASASGAGGAGGRESVTYRCPTPPVGGGLAPSVPVPAMPKRPTAVTVEDLVATLPLRALAGFAACSARLVQARATEYFSQESEGDRRADAVRLAAVLAEKVAVGEPPDAVEVEGIGEAVVEALMAVGGAAAERDDKETREAAFATNCAYAAVDAAAAACAADSADDPLEDARRVLVAATTGWEAARSIDALLDPVAAALKAELDAQLEAAGDGGAARFPETGPPVDVGKLVEAAERARADAEEAGRKGRPDDAAELRAELAAAREEIERLRAEVDTDRPETGDGSETATEPEVHEADRESQAEVADERRRLAERDAAYRAKFARLGRVVAKFSARRTALLERERSASESRTEIDELRAACERERGELAVRAEELSTEEERLEAERADTARRRAAIDDERGALDAERERLESDRAAYAEEHAAWHAARARCDDAVAALRDAAAAYEATAVTVAPHG